MRHIAALFIAALLVGCSTVPPEAPSQNAGAATDGQKSVCRNSPQFCEKVSPEEWKRRRAAAGL